MKGQRWLLLSRWVNLTPGKRLELNQLFALNRKVFKAYLFKESLDRLWTYHYEGAMLNFCNGGSISSAGSVWSLSRNWRRCCWTTLTAF